MKNEYFPPSWVDQKLIHKSANTAQLVEAASRTNINTTIRYLIASFPFQPDKCFGFFVESRPYGSSGAHEFPPRIVL